MRVITIANHKGGCAKTTIALNIAVMLATTGSQVLAVDIDPQGNLSAALGADLEALEQSQKTSHRLMLDDRGDYSSYLFNSRPRLDLLPACLDPDGESLLDSYPVSRELLLKQKLMAAEQEYQYCIIDTPPSLKAPTLNALAMADLTIVPIESSMFALLGLTQLLRTIAKVRRAHAPEMVIMALSTMYTSRQNLDKSIRTKVTERFTDDFVFQTTIPRTVSIGEAVATLQAVVEVAPESTGSFAFRKLVAEIKQVIGDEAGGRAEVTRRFAG